VNCGLVHLSPKGAKENRPICPRVDVDHATCFVRNRTFDDENTLELTETVYRGEIRPYGKTPKSLTSGHHRERVHAWLPESAQQMVRTVYAMLITTQRPRTERQDTSLNAIALSALKELKTNAKGHVFPSAHIEDESLQGSRGSFNTTLKECQDPRVYVALQQTHVRK
jgi:hypothetical protein